MTERPRPRDRDNAAERRTGDRWEREFCRLGARCGKVLTPHQIVTQTGGSASAWGWPIVGAMPSRYLLPDITVWSAPGEHHEIKHKNATRDGCYGLEVYRLDALCRWASITDQAVYYTIHDWQMAGAKTSTEDTPNRIDDWRYADVLSLAARSTKGGRDWSWRNGSFSLEEMRYWTADRYFRPLDELWTAVAA